MSLKSYNEIVVKSLKSFNSKHSIEVPLFSNLARNFSSSFNYRKLFFTLVKILKCLEPIKLQPEVIPFKIQTALLINNNKQI